MLIFLSGIHGVGKTYVGTRVAKQLRFEYATASELIRNELKEQSWTENKCVSSIDKNQEALISSVKRIRSQGEDLILDGHFVLRNKAGQVVPLGQDIFECLNLDQVILIEADSTIVEQRLKERGTPFSIEIIKELAENELITAQEICNKLAINFTRLYSPTEEQVINTVTAKNRF